MPAPAKTAHPLRSRTGASQRKRVLDALKPGMAAIDGRSLADILYFISRYAGQVNFHEYRLDEQEGEYIALSDWRDFFKNSPPFLLARLSKKDLGAIETQYLALAQALDEQPLAENLDQLFAFLESDLLQPVSDLYQAVQTAGISFESELANSIKSTLREPLLQFIALSNGAAQHLCTRKQNFSAYSAYPWQLSIQDLYALNACFKTLKGGKPAAIAEINQLLKPIFYQLLTGLGQISAKAPDHIQEALFPEEAALQKLHPPHLGLLFAFLELFKYLQGDLNALGQKHLDYFFSKALNIRAKAAVPDRAHLVFELANHLEQYALKKNTRIKDGKDGNNQDILFGLDQEIVLDKAAVAELRSLYVNTESVVADGQKLSFVEGVYAAPVANSADGKGKPFPAEGSKNWPTLGAKDSKCILPGQDEPEEHPPARIGFVLASPALLLQEGTREVIFNITCEPPIDKAGLACLKKYADPFSSDFQWGKFYWLTETAVQKLAASTEPVFSIETLQALNLLLARQNPYPVGYQIENLKALLYEEGCAVDQTKRTEEIKAYTTLLEADAEKTHACFIRKSDVDALPKSDLKLRLQNLFTDDQPDETVRYVDTRRLAQADLDFLTDAANDFKNNKLFGGSIFDLAFSGAESWIKPECVLATLVCDTDGRLTGFKIIAGLPPETPAVTFYDPVKLLEDFHLEHPFPAAKIELKKDVQFQLNLVDQPSGDPCDIYLTIEDSHCCLDKEEERTSLSVSLYDIFRDFKVDAAKIDVRVCGVKNLIVQNDENLQDVNSPILPFGVRPKVGENFNTKVGSNFYIGSKEVFCKNWQTFRMNTKWKDKPENLKLHYEVYKYGAFEDGSTEIEETSFKFHASILEDGFWKYDTLHATSASLFSLFETIPDVDEFDPCNNNYDPKAARYGHHFLKGFFENKTYLPKSMDALPLTQYGIGSQKGFARLTLAGVSFQHDLYAFILAKQMFDLAGLVNPVKINSVLEKIKLIKDDDPVTGAPSLITSLENQRDAIKGACLAISGLVNNVIDILGTQDPAGILPLITDIKNTIDNIDLTVTPLDLVQLGITLAGVSSQAQDIIDAIDLLHIPPIPPDPFDPLDPGVPAMGLLADIQAQLELVKTAIDAPLVGLSAVISTLTTEITAIENVLKAAASEDIGLPLEPYTPTIKELSIDYTAVAEMDDIDFVHLYPYDNTNKIEDIQEKPCLLPQYHDEGALFIGFKNLQPGGSLHLLFQLAEATADTEQERATVAWHYLAANRWLPLRPGFEVIDDATQGLTVSGIVQLLIPADITDRRNTVLPNGLFWIKASAAENVRAVSEAIGLHTQAARATALLPAGADTARLGAAIPPGSLAKLADADFSIKKIEQPYASFGGKRPEAEGHLYTRVSEHLRHKDRALMLFDYEHLVLEAFPEIYKTKCISHTMGLNAHSYQRDLEIAPGFVVLAVIPDLNKLVPGDRMEPRAPLSLLENIARHLRQRTSPFARLKVLNPRFEKVDVDISVRLHRGKPRDFFAKQLKTDLLHFLAPWYLGDTEKIAFGRNLLFSDVVKLVENLDYIDFIANLKLTGPCNQTGSIIRPLTARSILTGGTVCVTIVDEDCPPPTNYPLDLPRTG